MKFSVDELATEAMSLSADARALLAERIVESLDQEALGGLWLAEAKKRRDEVRNGWVEPISGPEVMKNIRKFIKLEATRYYHGKSPALASAFYTEIE